MSKRMNWIWLLLAFNLVGQTSLATPQQQDSKRAIIEYKDRFHSAKSASGMVASQQEHATRVGLDVLKKGGNAVDAAVAVGYALAVTLPKAGNLGGGGFMLVHLAKENRTVAINFREMAPAGATRDMYLDEQGKVDNQKARFSFQSAGVPGTVAGLSHALDQYGTMPLSKLVKPAWKLAAKGFSVSFGLSDDLTNYKSRLTLSPVTRQVFYGSDGAPPKPGQILIQKDLAWTLRKIARNGPKAFYEGPIARRLVDGMAANNGLITMEDMKNYRVVEMEPVRGTYRGYDVVSMPPPSSGGVHVIQMLNILEGFSLESMGHNSAAYIHTVSETMKLAYADRSEFLGDPAFFEVPVAGLTSKSYADSLRQTISEKRARPSTEIKPGKPAPFESADTTHYSVMDRWGNGVVVTYTINLSFGSGLMAPGTGFLLNNEMDDFSSKPGTPNAYGLVGGEANAIAAGKRPLSSMTPTIVFKDGKPYLLTGSPGGSTIITAVLQTILNVIDFKMNMATASSVPRFHHQWYPDQLRIESGIGIDTVRLLEEKGHRVVIKDSMGSTQSIMCRDGVLSGASDPRRPDALSMGY